MTNFVSTMRVYKKYIHSVFIFNKNGDDLYYSLCSGQLAQPYNPAGEEWYKSCTLLNGTNSISGVNQRLGVSLQGPVYCQEEVEFNDFHNARKRNVPESLPAVRSVDP